MGSWVPQRRFWEISMQLFISPVNHCNLRCTFCPGGAYDLEETLLPPDLLDKVIGEVERFGYPKRILYGEFGEQFLHPDNMDFIRRLKSAGFSFEQFFTNCTLLTDERDQGGTRVEELMEVLDERDVLITHLDWGREIYERNRGAPVYDRVRRAVVAMIRSPRRRCRLRIGCISAFPPRTRPSGQSGSARWTRPATGSRLVGVSDAEKMRYLDEIAGIASEAGLDRRPRLNCPIEEAGAVFFTRACSPWSNIVYDSGRPWPCWGLDQMHVLASGAVVLCCHDWLGETRVGNVRDSTLREIWEGEARRAHVSSIRRGEPLAAICRKCRMVGIRDQRSGKNPRKVKGVGSE